MVPTGKVTGALVVARSLYSYVVMTERVRVLGRIRHASDAFAGEIEANSMLDGGTEAMAERATELAGRGPCALATSINWDTGRACLKTSRSGDPPRPAPPSTRGAPRRSRFGMPLKTRRWASPNGFRRSGVMPRPSSSSTVSPWQVKRRWPESRPAPTWRAPRLAAVYSSGGNQLPIWLWMARAWAALEISNLLRGR